MNARLMLLIDVSITLKRSRPADFRKDRRYSPYAG
jgi:hypothetical protein